MARLDPEDDFVFTLSDEEAPNVDSDAEIVVNNKGKVTGTKRRRDEPENTQAEQSTNSKKRKKQKKGGMNATNSNKTDKGANDDAEEEDEFGEDENGVLDPDFEFDVGGVANGGLVEDFDGWGDEERNKTKVVEKKGVDIDDILDRRRQKKLEKEERERKKAEKRASEEREDMDNDEAEAEDDNDVQVDLDDDELLAPDAFGMGAQDASESEAEGEEAESDEDGEESNPEDEEEGGDDDDDDTNSVASAVPHPDDLASDEDGSGSESEDDDEIRKQNEFFAPEEQVTELKSTSRAPASFQNLSLSRPILRGLASVGFSTPTPIQRKTIPVALLGKDVVGGAVTGSGKTGAFIVPILERLLYRPRKVPTSRVAILMPTRELAVQCYNVATKLATFTDITFCQLVGGFSLREQENILKKRPDVIIATPGRFIDHMRNSASFTVDTLEILVLDEADRMLEDGFAEELNEILTTIPKSRQTMLFSATMTSSVDKLIRLGLNKPVRLMVDSKKQTVGTLVQEFVRLRPGREDKRLGYLMFLCKTVYTNRVIVFFRQKKEAHRVRIIFGLMGLKAAELHGSMSQEQRIKSVEDFRDAKVSYLLATDLASRGLDIKGVETVINYEAPQSHEIYLHRVGRTARAGRSGRACTIAAEPDRKVVKEAVKAGRAQGAKIVSRVIEPAVADKWAEQVNDLATEVEEVLQEEKEEKQLAQAEMQVTRGKNLIDHQEEIMSRPKRTWFESEKEKRESKKRGLMELNGPDSVKKGKKKLSGKDKKKLDDARMREEGRVWKKGKAEREAKPGSQNKGKKKKNSGKAGKKR
ncbi:ATP-dependent RNA helicase DRS1 [Trichophyton rubrum D6]|uniref:RNA helicase n=4 Tax=Trichophyton TaxID=5550 RepID=A0A178F837_TRIRU|nr:ATP-dependent RNA helicase DRS1 [Trichophyton rubrum CBS 118892]EZF26431.1 ATP-dependent RNA helicase DRS1 [Trichophyton rubrum MR850]EZF45544.1 ATP-dependent RNA helicase DRS1 [Trichophyton rubrum CBS 100081]EZF56193.1 ATP-dependent RNA helicase DRS1 [Trichophyton rubrum CBS 288.86]EZF66731.1 ATP-dependent RNA helicase DRS1 [Trichophyton rubrum CBS 289.86]EZF77435.1 ATP-dependent RNA helicase DRS1 [Trichophyton soudanense CBS 452.61]EZF88020.1 ATP-dependent RNA helicase DRS1 [Trichophyton